MIIVCGPIVRRTTTTSVTLWVELDRDGVVKAHARGLRGPLTAGTAPKRPPDAVSGVEFTVNVGGRFFAVLTLQNLAPGWVYGYELYYRPSLSQPNRRFTSRDPLAGNWSDVEVESRAIAGKRPTFRTFPVPKSEDVRVAFGSCRTFGGGNTGGQSLGPDVLALFGEHLRKTATDRLTTWPHLLLLLGDQIYADNVDRRVQEVRLKSKGRAGKRLYSMNAPESILEWERDRIPKETKWLFRQRVLGTDHGSEEVEIPDFAGWGGFQSLQFEDFALLYQTAWTEAEVARVLANVPTFMIFDDHDFANDWNLSGGWFEQMKKSPGWSRALTEGLVAYWMYQGWGNPPSPGAFGAPGTFDDSRFTILRDAAVNGTDALEPLRKWFEERHIKGGRASYYYEIEIYPPILVLDTRNDRVFVAPKQRGADNVTVHADYDDEIISENQWTWLRKQIDRSGPLILASGVPWLQLLCPDWWLLMGTRSENAFVRGLEEQSQEMADIFEFYRRKIGTDQWTAFPKSFTKLLQELMDRGPFVLLSGDVHYAYGMLGRADLPPECKLGRNPLLLHAVSSPLQSQWTPAELKTNDPELYCHFSPSEVGPMAANMRRAARERLIQDGTKLKPGERCDLLQYPSQFSRVLLPDATPLFDAGSGKKKWTHLNNIGLLWVAHDGRTVKVSWLGASTKKGEPLRELGSLASRPGEFIR